MKRPEKLPPLELIEWVDSYKPGRYTWMSLEDLQRDHASPCVAYSAGFVTYETKTVVAVSDSWSESSQSAPMIIPKCAVLRRTRLRA